jgi:voltage-gated potassium channel Kch
MLWLAAISAAMVAVAAIFLALGIRPDGEEEALPYGESFWTTLNMALSPGTVEDPGWPYRLLMLAVAILGVLIVSTIIGVLTAGIEGKLDDLRRGRSIVLERDHTIILGWSSKIAAAVQELVIANESRSRAVIAILADRDKLEMEEYLTDRVSSLGPTELICRRGDPCDLADLAIVRPETARSALLFSDTDGDSDALVLKRSLALKRMSERTGRDCPVIAEVQDRENGEAVRRAGDVQVVEPAQLVTRILLQAARQPSLSLVYDELLSFHGCEIYFHSDAQLNGSTFGDAAMSFPKAAAIGVVPDGGKPLLNPPIDFHLSSGDQLIVVAEDDSDIAASLDSPLVFDSSECRDVALQIREAESYLIVGWHRWATILVNELDEHLAEGSTIHVMYDPACTDGPSDDLAASLTAITLTVEEATTTRRTPLERLDLSRVDEIVLLSYRDTLDAQTADSRTLLTLVHLRDMVESVDRPIGIATELLDARNRALASRGREDDFIASEELVSNVMVQLAENPDLGAVLDELLTADGSELYLRKAANYTTPGTAIAFGSLVQEGLRRGEAVIGTITWTASMTQPSLRMAIDKSEQVTLEAGDGLIVVAP